MNKPLAIQFLNDEVRRMMKRIAKCDTHILQHREPVAGESNEARKTRLLATVAERMKQIGELSK